jgi:F-type H+-transporting ATPase subunit b
VVVAAAVLAATPASAAAAAGGGGSSLITPQLGLIFWTSLTFVLLLLVLGRFAWRPLLGAIEERERTIRENLEQARREREAAASLLEEHRALVVEARKERAQAVAAGQADAERLKAEILQEAKRQRETVLHQTDAQVEAMLRQARDEMRTLAADLAIRAASKIIARNLDDAVQRKFVEEYLADLDRHPGERGAGG